VSASRRLRDLRAEAGITGGELARRAGWTHPKTSRLENARTAPTPADIRAWCAACGADDQAADLIAASRDAEEQYCEWRRRVRAGLRNLQDSYRPRFEQTTLWASRTDSRLTPAERDRHHRLLVEYARAISAEQLLAAWPDRWHNKPDVRR
jgi:transcriptional regulator with XRE-family HTH domain